MSNRISSKDEILLGIDYGETNIGLAFGRRDLAVPLKIISGKNTMTAIDEIIKVGLENKISKFIVGLPLNYESKETLMSKKVRSFAKTLKIYSKKPVDYVNEYNTSNDALEEVLNLDGSRKSRRSVDQYSAGLILKEYYNTRA